MILICHNLYIMSIDAKRALQKTQESLNSIQTLADKVFIASADAQIKAAIQLGQTQITAVTGNQVNVSTVFNYYNNLGYLCAFPDYLQQNGQALPSIVQQPVNFFGFNWTQFWLNAIGAFHIRNPARMTIRWNLYPLTPYYPGNGDPDEPV
jgi:hypothetical protein